MTSDTHLDPDDLGQRSRFPGNRAVLDPRDAAGHRNALIDRIHRGALGRAIAETGAGRFAVAVDLGCGIGRLTPLLLEHADAVVGLDPDEGMLARAREAHGSPRTTFAPPDAVPPLAPPVLVVSVYVLAQLPEAMVEEELADLRARAGDGAHLVLIERIAHRPERAPVDIPARTPRWYGALLRRAGWEPVASRRVRREVSVPVLLNARVAARLPDAVGRPASAAIAAAEQRLAGIGQRGSYVDLLMRARAGGPQGIPKHGRS